MVWLVSCRFRNSNEADIRCNEFRNRDADRARANMLETISSRCRARRRRMVGLNVRYLGEDAMNLALIVAAATAHATLGFPARAPFDAQHPAMTGPNLHFSVSRKWTTGRRWRARGHNILAQ